jgi:hypothetical protein
MIHEHFFELLQPICGQKIWDVHRSVGSCFLAQFGPKGPPIKRLRPNHPRGDFYHHGLWNMLVTMGDWRIETPEGVADHLTESAQMQRVMDRLEGRILRHIGPGVTPLSTVFVFEPEARLVTERSSMTDIEIDEELWQMQMPDGVYHTLHQNGVVSIWKSNSSV